LTRLLLVRHGETDWTVQGRFSGHTDLPLNERGQRQATAVAHRLSSEMIQTIYTSDLQRVLATAEAIAQAIANYQEATRGGPIVLPDRRLREVDLGEWDGLTYAEILRRDPDIVNAWQDDFLKTAPPGGESLEQLADRLKPFLLGILAGFPEKTLVVAGHAGSLQCLVCMALGLSVKMYWQFRMAPASISQISIYPEGAIVNSLNDTCHLDGI
jgi:broad specificity phosphatase PhoE